MFRNCAFLTVMMITIVIIGRQEPKIAQKIKVVVSFFFGSRDRSVVRRYTTELFQFANSLPIGYFSV